VGCSEAYKALTQGAERRKVNIIKGALRAITKTAEGTTAVAGALGGAAVSGVIGGVQGTVSGIRSGLSSGSHSTSAAVLTLGVIGATGLVEWPILLGIGATALVVNQVSQRSGGQSAPTLAVVPDTSSPSRAQSRAKRGPARKPAKATKSAARTSAPRARRSPAKR
jgi:hypothetical protein